MDNYMRRAMFRIDSLLKTEKAWVVEVEGVGACGGAHAAYSGAVGKIVAGRIKRENGGLYCLLNASAVVTDCYDAHNCRGVYEGFRV